MVLFKNLLIAVSYGQRMLSPDYELIRVPRVFIVMNHVGEEGRKHIRELEEIAHVTCIH